MAFDKTINPLVSVIIPTYNRAKYITKALDSVLFQSYQDFEIIIVDDGSTDNTKEILQSYLKDPRVFYIYQENQKVSRARNNGIAQSRGEYIALLDSDDYWLDGKKLEKQVDFFEKHPDYLLTSGGIIRVAESGKEISKILNPKQDEVIRQSMLFSCLFTPSGAMFKKSIFEKIGGFNQTSDLSEDWEFFLEIGKYGKFYNFQGYFVAYLQGSQNRSNFNRRDNLKYNLGLIKKYRGVYPHFKKAHLIHICYYLYSFLPFKNGLLPIFSIIKKTVFGKPSYRITK
ncbi:MAG: glycosyltransferase [Candidatus Staskawiczbacteria bacterium]|nr:glycosyltransferase [Candidatus Staskawiczbacteria bacterium]